MKSEGAKCRRTHRIFLSYSRVDKWVPRNYIEPLRQIEGISVFYDGDIQPGEPFSTRITDKLRSADELLVILSPSSVNRPWVLVEIGMALAMEIPIVPILYNYTMEEARNSPVGDFLAHRQHVDGPDEFDRYLCELRDRCSGKGGARG